MNIISKLKEVFAVQNPVDRYNAYEKYILSKLEGDFYIIEKTFPEYMWNAYKGLERKRYANKYSYEEPISDRSYTSARKCLNFIRDTVPHIPPPVIVSHSKDVILQWRLDNGQFVSAEIDGYTEICDLITYKLSAKMQITDYSDDELKNLLNKLYS